MKTTAPGSLRSTCNRLAIGLESLTWTTSNTLPVAWRAWRQRFGLWVAIWNTAKAARGALTGLAYSLRASKEAEERLAICEECFTRSGRSCGTPGEFITGSDHQFGCWCTLYLAAHDPKKKCWNKVAGGPDAYGWPTRDTAASAPAPAGPSRDQPPGS